MWPQQPRHYIIVLSLNLSETISQPPTSSDFMLLLLQREDMIVAWLMTWSITALYFRDYRTQSLAMFSNLSEIQTLNLKYGNPMLDFTRIILSFQTIFKFTTVALCSKNPYCKHHWTDEARILSWEKHDGILLYLTQISTRNWVLARFYASHVISIRPWSYLFKSGIWLENTYGRDNNSTPCWNIVSATVFAVWTRPECSIFLNEIDQRWHGDTPSKYFLHVYVCAGQRTRQSFQQLFQRFASNLTTAV